LRSAIFFFVTYVLSWTFWYAAARLMRGPNAAEGAAMVLIYLGTFTPGIVALALTVHADGSAGARKLLARLVQHDVNARWYVFAITFTAAVEVAVALIHRMAFGAWPPFGGTPIALMFAGTLLSLITLGQAGEELGWRGFALPRLTKAMGLGWASIVLGMIWAAWHLPLFFLFPTADTHGQSFPLYFAQVVGLSVAFGWLWWRTNGSLLLTMLLHAAVNNTKDIVLSVNPGATDVWTLTASRPAWITVAVLWVCAVAFLVDMRKGRDQSGYFQT
jgi:uncharacterized protein